jgi:hypothetical protein
MGGERTKQTVGIRNLNSVTKKNIFLGIKKIGGTIAPFC